MARSTPLVEDGVLILQQDTHSCIKVDSDEWWRWLERETVTTFYFKHRSGHFTARREQKRNGFYWYAYRKYQRRLTKIYLGKTEELLATRLEQVAIQLATMAKPQMVKEGTEVYETKIQTLGGLPTSNIRSSEPQKRLHSPLLTTKLYLPPTRPDQVVRSKLLDTLDRGRHSTLTLISAPAGFGKTTLLSAWQAQSKRPYAWLSLDQGDNDAGRFWLYMATALQKEIPKIEHEIIPILSSLTHPPTEAILTVLLNTLAEAGRNVTVLLDDYHVISRQEIHDGLTFFLEHLPTTMHIVIASRTDPPLPLVHLRASGQLLELHANDLRFSTAEVKTFLREIMHLELSAEEMLTLEAQTEGWIVGLQLVALSLQGQEHASAFIAAFTGSHRYILDYLSSEVLQRQPEPIRTFLLQTAILERLSGSLCNAVTGQDDGQAMLEELERRHLFLIPLDEQRHWYRYHHLFAEFLQECLQQTQTNLLPQLHMRASEWYEQQNLLAEAIAHALQADAIDRALQLFEDAAIDMMKNGDLVTILQLLHAFPEEKIRARVRVNIVRASALVGTGQLDTAEHYLQEIEPALEKIKQAIKTTQEQAAYEQIDVEFAAARSVLAAFRADLTGTIRWSLYALDHLQTEDNFIRSIVATSLGSAYLLLGNLQAAYETYTQAIQAAILAENTHAELAGIGALGFIQAAYGHLQQAIETLHYGIQKGRNESGRIFPVISMAYASLGQICYERNNLEEAQRYALDGVEQGKRWGYSGTLAQCSTILATVQMLQGKTAEAFATMEQLERLVVGNNIMIVSGLIYSAKAQLHLRAGQLEQAVRWTQTCRLSEEDTITYPRDGEYLILTQILLAQGETQRARLFLERILLSTEADGRKWTQIDSLIQLALLEQAEGAQAEAIAYLTRALRLAANEGFVRVFLDKGEALLSLLRVIATSSQAPAYARTLLAAAGEVTHDDGLLSGRELHILKCIAAGMSNQIIAQELVIEVSTVKTHLSNIYGKLGVHSRTQALVQARKMQLLR